MSDTHGEISAGIALMLFGAGLAYFGLDVTPVHVIGFGFGQVLLAVIGS